MQTKQVFVVPPNLFMGKVLIFLIIFYAINNK